MSSDVLDPAAAAVLARYPASCHGIPQPLGNHGGFSGARLWRVAGRCLRAWPPDDSFPARLHHTHHLMTLARGAGLKFVPRLELSTDQSSCVEYRGRWWELAEWMPGRADYRDRPTTVRLETACSALARLHRSWGQGHQSTGECPAVARRFDRLLQWQRLRGWSPPDSASQSESLGPLIERAESVLTPWLPLIPTWLLRWTTARWSLQPCLCDVWHDHLLFEDDRLTGLIDYGSVKLDHVAVDLARLLGSLVEDDDECWQIGLAAYRGVRPLSAEEEELARALDRTGTLLGVANWLRWLSAEGRTFDDLDAVTRRLETLVAQDRTLVIALRPGAAHAVSGI